MSKYSFNKDFLLGTATSSYQIEGARELRDDCIWDDFCKIPGKVLNQDNGDIACDAYHHLDLDIELLKELKVNSYRFSISWPRLIKNGFGEVNLDGLNYYKNLVKKLKENNIEPLITLYHWDLPSCLQKLGGWENPESINWFLYYAKVVFEEFKNDVKYFVTLNEPFCAINLGYNIGVHAPGYNNLKASLVASINILKAHGEAVKLFRRLKINGKIGICLNINDYRPINNEAIDATSLVRNKEVWWYYYPLFLKKFPENAVTEFKKLNVMPDVTKEDIETISEPMDFIGLNYYQSQFYNSKGEEVENSNYEHNSLGWNNDPMGLYNVIKEMSVYCKLPIYVLENGTSTNSNNMDEEIHDIVRVKYYKEHLNIIKKCIDDGFNVKGYFAWSLMDNFEWAFGYQERFGIVYVDYKDNNKRYIKDSGYFIKKVAEEIKSEQ